MLDWNFRDCLDHTKLMIAPQKIFMTAYLNYSFLKVVISCLEKNEAINLQCGDVTITNATVTWLEPDECCRYGAHVFTTDSRPVDLSPVSSHLVSLLFPFKIIKNNSYHTQP